MIVTKNNFKSPHLTVLYALFILIAIGLLIISFTTNKKEILYITLGILIFLGILFTIGYTTKIQIEEKGISYKSLRNEFLINWKDVKTVGVCQINKYGVKNVKPENYNKFSFMGQKFIYVSTKKDFLPELNDNISNEYMSFHWRAEVWDEMHKYYSSQKSAS